MNIYVCVKQVPDTETKVVLESDGKAINTSAIKWVVNPYDEYAIELAMQIKDRLQGAPNVIVIRVGESNPTVEVLRTAMAMGADEAIHVELPKYTLLDPTITAKALEAAIKKFAKPVDLILAGKQSIDADNSQVPQMLAARMGLECATAIGSYKVVEGSEMASGVMEVTRDLDGGSSEVLSVRLPALLSCNKGLNTPRYPSLPGIMKAKKKPLTKYTMGDLGLEQVALDSDYAQMSLVLPPEKAPGKKVVMESDNPTQQKEMMKQAVEFLRSEAKVI
ncbi:MAG: electron transfer flavoprotein subunit beta/FixA family protein [Oligoflexia bacterium]|nr:electron transfer flavoprotein subunit beta/FixA family protein [Oligoflexia bacterium]MBF0364677.1 electron transfer flavoprotein subunit beta/FixA family protein [Oligoflexia bacterium]